MRTCKPYPGLLCRIGLAFLLCPGAAAVASRPVEFQTTVAVPATAVRVERLSGGGGLEALRIRVDGSEVEGVSYETRPGLPLLPFVEKLVAVPFGAKDVTLTIQPGPSTALDTASLVEWAQIPRPGQAAPGGSPVEPWPAPDAVALDESVVAGSTWPPGDGFVAGTSSAAGWQLVRVRLHPLRWTAGSGELVVHESMSFKVSWSGGRKARVKDEAALFQADMLKSVVANPEAIVVPNGLARPDAKAWPYLIITDDRTWDEQYAAAGTARPGIISEFQRLAQHRMKRGTRARVVTITSILAGNYGDFSDSSGLTYRVIRKFLRFAAAKWKTRWVLLGGGAEIVPPAQLYGFGGKNSYWAVKKTKPDKGATYLDTETGLFRIHLREPLVPVEPLWSGSTWCKWAGRAILFIDKMPGPDNPGWAFATDDSYSARSSTPTEYVVVGGMNPEDFGGGYFVARRRENDIPTDLAFSALKENPFWDTKPWGGADCMTYPAQVDPWPDLIVGRAPVADATEAGNFVDKVVGYETHSGLPTGFSGNAVLASDNWDSPVVLSRDLDPAGLPAGKYDHDPGDLFARLRLTEAPAGFWADWSLYAETAGVRTMVDYSFTPMPGASLHYTWCADPDCLIWSAMMSPFGAVYPKLSTDARVWGQVADLEPDAFVIDRSSADASMTQKEDVAGAWASDHPWIATPDRIYADFLDAADYPAANLQGVPWTNLMPRLSAGFNVASLSGHGSYGGCCGLKGVDVGTLTNGFAGGLVYADSCLTGEFDVAESGAGLVSTAQRMVTSPNGGSAAYIGNSRYSWIGVGSQYEQRFWKLLQKNSYPAKANALSKVDSPVATTAFWTNATLTYFGDPMMALWRSEPQRVEVGVPATITARGILSVDLSGALGAQAVTVTGDLGYFDTRAVVAGSDKVDFQLKAKVGEVLSVVVTGEAIVPVTSQVTVMR